jgi:tRNA A-37 threonylcarbamoyl transferase component Bud32
MGTVYAGVHPVIGKRVAIKVLHAALSIDRASLDRFQREAQAVNRIGHPTVVDVFAFGQLPGGAPYLVMEWLDGQSLGARLRGGAMTLAEVQSVFGQLLHGLQAAHEVGVVHRDLKPDNIMLLRRPAGQVKILDFGIAKLVGEDQPSLTRSGIALGTPAYMSPEQALGRPIGPQTDLYSVAVMLYLAVAGRPPFVADSAFEVQRRHVTQPPEPPSLFAEMPRELEALILRGLAKEPGGRFASAREMAEALLAVPPGELRRRIEVPLFLSGPGHGTPGAAGLATPSGGATLADVARRHLRKLVVVFLAPDASGCPEAGRQIAEALEDGLLTRLCELAEVDIIRPSAGPYTTGSGTGAPAASGRIKGEAAARSSGADLYIEITLQILGGGAGAPVRANLRIGNTSPEEAPFSQRLQAAQDQVYALEDQLYGAIEGELKQRARGHILRVRLVGDQVSHPAQRALQQAEQGYSAPWENTAVIEGVLRAADQALSIDGEYAEAYYRRGTTRLWLASTAAGAAGDDQVDAAIADLREAHRRLPSFAPGSLFLSLALGLRGQISESLRVVDEAATQEVTRPGLRATESLVCDVTLAWQRLLAMVLPGEAIFADQGLPLLSLSRVLLALGRAGEAAEVARRLLRIEAADLAATRTGQRRTMRTLPLYGPSLVLGAALLRQGDARAARDVLQEARARLQSCEHVTAPVHHLLALRLLIDARRQIGEGVGELQMAEDVLARRIFGGPGGGLGGSGGDDAEGGLRRAFRLMGFFWVPGCQTAVQAPLAAPPWRHFLTAVFAVRNGEWGLAVAAAERMVEVTSGDGEADHRADAAQLLSHVESIRKLAM